MFGRGTFGVGRCTQVFAGRSFSPLAVFTGSAGGTPSRYQAGSCGPVRRSVVHGVTPYFAAPAASALSAATVHVQVWLPPSATATSVSLTAAGRKPLTGPRGQSFSDSQCASNA